MRPGLWGLAASPGCGRQNFLRLTAANNGAMWLSLSPGQRKWVAFAPVIRCLLGHPLAQIVGEVPTRGLGLPPLVSPFRTKHII